MGQRLSLSALACAALIGIGANANATTITQTFTATTGCGVSDCGTSGGTVTFTDSGTDASLASNQLKITFDNTTVASNVGPGSYLNSSVITGIVFNIQESINLISSFSFVDGNGTDLTSLWQIALNVDSNISPGNTIFDVTFDTTNGISGGIYNAADPGSNINNVFPDIAVLILTIGDPDPYNLTSVGDDSILRMQRVGTAGEGSLKIPTSTSSSSSGGGGASTSGPIPEPGTLTLMGAAILGGLFQYRRRNQTKA